MNNERDEYFKQLQDRLNNSLDELSDTSVDNSLQEDNTRDPQEEYLKLIDAYNEKLNAPEKKLGWEDYIGDAAAAAHNILNYTQGNVMPNIEVGSVKAANKRISDEKNKSISGLQDLQGMYQKYMDMQRRADQDRRGKERFNWEKTRAEKQDELRQKQYTDKEQERKLSNQLMQKKLDQYGQLTPYQQKMIEQQELERELKKELAKKKDKKGKDIYKLGDELVRVGDDGAESLYKAEKDKKEDDLSFEDKEKVKEQANIRKENLKTRKQAEKSIADLDAQLEKIRRAKKLMKDTSKNIIADTGPIDQFISPMTNEGQKLRQAFNDLSLEKMSKLFQGMSKAVDSDAERKMFEQSQASLGNYPEVNMDILNQMENSILSLKNKNKNLMQRYNKKGEEVEQKNMQETQIAPQDKAAIEWLKANPNNPKAEAVMQKLKDKGVL